MIVVIPAVNVMSWCCAVPKFSVTTVFAAGDDAVVLIPAAIVIVKEYLDKKHVEMAAERFIDLLADYGLSDQALTELLGNDYILDNAINYYLEVDDDTDDYNDEEDEY